MNIGDLCYRTPHKLGEEGRQVGVVPPALASGWLVLFAHAERLCFHVEVGLGIDVDGVERDVSKPRPLRLIDLLAQFV